MPVSLETRRKQSLAKMGNKNRLGAKLSEESRRKISEGKKGQKWTPEQREKIEARYAEFGGANKGRKFPQCTGESHWNWKGGYQNTLSLNRRRKALKKSSVTGHHTGKEWMDLKESLNNECQICFRGEDKVKLVRDHKIPLSKGGCDDISNIQPLCVSCNSRKKDKILTSFNLKPV